MKIIKSIYVLLFICLNANCSIDYKKIVTLDTNNALIGSMVVVPLFTNFFYRWYKLREINNAKSIMLGDKKNKSPQFFSENIFYTSLLTAIPLTGLLVLNGPSGDIFKSKMFFFAVGGVLLESIIFASSVNNSLKSEFQKKQLEIENNNNQGQKGASLSTKLNSGGGGPSSAQQLNPSQDIISFNKKISNPENKPFNKVSIVVILNYYIALKENLRGLCLNWLNKHLSPSLCYKYFECQKEIIDLLEGSFNDWLKNVTVVTQWNLYTNNYMLEINDLIKIIFDDENKAYFTEYTKEIFKLKFKTIIDCYFNQLMDSYPTSNKTDIECIIKTTIRCLQEIEKNIENKAFRAIGFDHFNEKFLLNLQRIQPGDFARVMKSIFQSYNVDSINLLNETSKQFIKQGLKKYLHEFVTHFWDKFENSAEFKYSVKDSAEEHYQLINEYQKLFAVCKAFVDNGEFKEKCQTVIELVNKVLKKLIREKVFIIDNSLTKNLSQAYYLVEIIFDEKNKDFFADDTKNAVKYVIKYKCENDRKFLCLPALENNNLDNKENIEEYNTQIDQYSDKLAHNFSTGIKYISMIIEKIEDNDFKNTIKNIINTKTQEIINSQHDMLNNIEQLKEFANFIFFKKYKDFYNKSTKEALIKKIVLFVKAKCFVVKEADFSNKNNPTIRSNVDLIEKAYKEDISDLHKIINFIKIDSDEKFKNDVLSAVDQKKILLNGLLIEAINDKGFGGGIEEVNCVVKKVFNKPNDLFNDNTKDLIKKKIIEACMGDALIKPYEDVNMPWENNSCWLHIFNLCLDYKSNIEKLAKTIGAVEEIKVIINKKALEILNKIDFNDSFYTISSIVSCIFPTLDYKDLFTDETKKRLLTKITEWAKNKYFIISENKDTIAEEILELVKKYQASDFLSIIPLTKSFEEVYNFDENIKTIVNKKVQDIIGSKEIVFKDITDYYNLPGTVFHKGKDLFSTETKELVKKKLIEACKDGVLIKPYKNKMQLDQKKICSYHIFSLCEHYKDNIKKLAETIGAVKEIEEIINEKAVKIFNKSFLKESVDFRYLIVLYIFRTYKDLFTEETKKKALEKIFLWTKEFYFEEDQNKSIYENIFDLICDYNSFYFKKIIKLTKDFKEKFDIDSKIKEMIHCRTKEVIESQRPSEEELFKNWDDIDKFSKIFVVKYKDFFAPEIKKIAFEKAKQWVEKKLLEEKDKENKSYIQMANQLKDILINTELQNNN